MAELKHCQHPRCPQSSTLHAPMGTDDWFFGVDGQTWCPEHLPAWVIPWRQRKQVNRRTRQSADAPTIKDQSTRDRLNKLLDTHALAMIQCVLMVWPEAKPEQVAEITQLPTETCLALGPFRQVTEELLPETETPEQTGAEEIPTPNDQPHVFSRSEVTPLVEAYLESHPHAQPSVINRELKINNKKLVLSISKNWRNKQADNGRDPGEFNVRGVWPSQSTAVNSMHEWIERHPQGKFHDAVVHFGLDYEIVERVWIVVHATDPLPSEGQEIFDFMDAYPEPLETKIKMPITRAFGLPQTEDPNDRVHWFNEWRWRRQHGIIPDHPTTTDNSSEA